MIRGEIMFDVIIIGAGPAGMAAAIYAGRAKLDTLLLEKEFAGGQVAKTYEVANYPGIAAIIGPDLALQMQEHAKVFGISPVVEEVTEVQLEGKTKIVKTRKHTYESKTVIIATGANWKELGLPMERTLRGKGVSYCATCDGAFFDGKVTAIVGGGDTAVEDAIFLARHSPKVYVIHRRNQFRAAKVLQEKLFEQPNVEVLWDTEVLEIIGDDTVKGIRIKNNKNGEMKELEIEGLFVAIGTIPNGALFTGKVAMDEVGYIQAGEDCKTDVPGVFVAGDLRRKVLMQIITAAADGAVALYGVEKFIIEEYDQIVG